MNLTFGKPQGEPLEILCLGAHSDDIEIGCGGTILQLAKRTPAPHLRWVVFSAAGTRGQEAAAAAQRFTAGCAVDLHLKEFKDGFMPWNGGAVKEFFEELKKGPNPDLIFTHWSGDAHQDHRLISELTWNTFRNHQILEYEIPKYDGDMGRPNVFVALDEAACKAKVQHLMDCFGTQRSKAWFGPETFLGLMRLRGMECVAHSGFAEAFHGRKVRIDVAI